MEEREGRLAMVSTAATHHWESMLLLMVASVVATVGPPEPKVTEGLVLVTWASLVVTVTWEGPNLTIRVAGAVTPLWVMVESKDYREVSAEPLILTAAAGAGATQRGLLTVTVEQAQTGS